MSAPQMQGGIPLPGGLCLNAGKPSYQSFYLTSLNGHIELDLSDLLETCTREGAAHPDWLSQFLSRVVRFERQCSPSPEDIQQLCVADIQCMVLHWRMAHMPETEWFTEICDQCNHQFDFSVNWQHLPLKPAGDTFPRAKAFTSLGELRLRVPNCADQSWLISHMGDDQKTLTNSVKTEFAARLVLHPERINLETLTTEDVCAIESAVESVAPEYADHMVTQCPECNQTQGINLDLYNAMTNPLGDVLDDIHQLAANYHWSEAAILDLPLRRRKVYLKKLEQTRGMEAHP